MIEKGEVREYFPRYKSLWAEMRRAPERKSISHGFHASYLDTHLLVSIVPEAERELFAANMYGHGLLAQVFHTFVRVSGSLWDFIHSLESHLSCGYAIDSPLLEPRFVSKWDPSRS